MGLTFSRAGRPRYAIAVGALAITAVTLLIDVLKPYLDPWSLTALYLVAVVPVAIGWGFWPAGIAAVASYLTFEYFFVPPIPQLRGHAPRSGSRNCSSHSPRRMS